ncbi:olfactory receptor 1-like [Lithobates pipiens]
MENQTFLKDFYLLPFSIESDYKSLIIGLYFILYLSGVFVNSFIMVLIFSSSDLHTPMYMFLCSLSFTDISYTTAVAPKHLDILISENNSISFNQCFTQMYFYTLVGITENMVILAMAFDRYVAICNPLRYNSILRSKNCISIITGIWISGCLNSLVITVPLSYLPFCISHTIHQFFCDGKALIDIACAGVNEFYIVIYIETFFFSFCPCICSLISYVKIIKVILQIQTREGRKKAFSTCSSHLIVIIMYYTTAILVYMMPESYVSLQQVCLVLFTAVTPMLNPLIYSLRNNDVKLALLRLMAPKIYFQT